MMTPYNTNYKAPVLDKNKLIKSKDKENEIKLGLKADLKMFFEGLLNCLTKIHHAIYEYKEYCENHKVDFHSLLIDLFATKDDGSETYVSLDLLGFLVKGSLESKINSFEQIVKASREAPLKDDQQITVRQAIEGYLNFAPHTESIDYDHIPTSFAMDVFGYE